MSHDDDAQQDNDADIEDSEDNMDIVVARTEFFRNNYAKKTKLIHLVENRFPKQSQSEILKDVLLSFHRHNDIPMTISNSRIQQHQYIIIKKEKHEKLMKIERKSLPLNLRSPKMIKKTEQ